ncbi:MAG: choice-of-anchor tandem repeat GloVer-containing protein [Terriglobales bacterium]
MASSRCYTILRAGEATERGQRRDWSAAQTETYTARRQGEARRISAQFLNWTAKATLRSYTALPGGRDGAQPLVPLILDGAGNLYGTTYLGGAPKCNVGNNGACGSVFTVTMTGKKAGKEKVLFRFSSPKKYGSFPYGSLMLDSAGNLYGTASLNGPGHEGVVLKLGASGGATVLHSFSFHPDGVPSSALIQDAAGNLYGTTGVGAGDVYELDPLGNETVLHIFGGSEGTEPFQSGVIMDGDGNLYGTMYSGGNEVACNG